MYIKEIRELILQKRSNGESYKQIADNLELTKSKVQSVCNYKYKSHQKKTVTKPKLGDYESLKIRRYVTKKLENGCKVNASMIKEDLDLPVTTRTINNWFLKRDIHYSKQRQKHPTNRST